jgi:hypothetical protein
VSSAVLIGSSLGERLHSFLSQTSCEPDQDDSPPAAALLLTSKVSNPVISVDMADATHGSLFSQYRRHFVASMLQSSQSTSDFALPASFSKKRKAPADLHEEHIRRYARQGGPDLSEIRGVCC